MTYADTLDYLFARLPMYSRIGAAAYKEDLHNTIALLEAIGNPHRSFKTIHVAGTNGKGSVSHMLAAILQAAGYKTGLYTSPHLVDFRERIRINGTMIPEANVVAFTARMKPFIQAIYPSFFELTVAMAFDHFATEQVDIAVIETGLGGRLDSTNVIRPELCVITNIGWDHMNLLGDSLEKIAFEKAGIIKANTPVVIGEWRPETKPVFEQTAIQTQSPVQWAGTHFEVERFEWDTATLSTTVKNKDTGNRTDYQLDLPGRYQLKNLITVLESVRALIQQGWQIPDPAVQEALRNVKGQTGFRGRWDILQRDPLVVLDVAHNTHGIEQVLLQVHQTTHKQLHLIIGMVNDKNIEEVLSMLPKTALYYFTQASIPRALPANELKKQAQLLGLTGEIYEHVNRALEQAKSIAGKEDMILVTGSIFLIGEVGPR